MPMATIHKVGTGELYHIHFLDQRTDPGFGGGAGGGVDPGYGQGHLRPDRPDHSLPGGGADTKRVRPGSPAIPDHELPDQPPPQVAAGQTLILVRGPAGHWAYATLAPGSPPPRPMPTPPPVHPGNRPPGSGEHPSGQPVPPTATPTR